MTDEPDKRHGSEGEGPHSLAYLLQAHCLPTVAYLESDIATSSTETPFIGQSVLLWSVVHRDLVRARSITKDPTTGECIEDKQELAIPNNYNGLFEILEPPNQCSYTTIAEISCVMPKCFFTKTPFQVMEVMKRENGHDAYYALTITAGSVLKTVKVFTTRWKRTVETGIIQRRTKEVVTEEVSYLECETSKNKRIFITLLIRGRFYAVFDEYRQDKGLKCVYNMGDLIQHVNLPVVCRLVYGKEPFGACSFTGVMRLVDIEKSSVLIGSTLRKTKNELFEVDMNSLLKVKFTSDHTDSAYDDARSLCSKYASPFSSLIKPHIAPNADCVSTNGHVNSSVRSSLGDSSKHDIVNDITRQNQVYKFVLSNEDSFWNLDDDLTTLTTYKPTEDSSLFIETESETTC